MITIRFAVLASATILGCSLFLNAQQPAPSVAAAAVVPRLVSFSGKAVDAQGKPLSGIAGVTFAIYKDQAGGAPLWMETQNVQADSKGNYSTQLGATKSDGLPVELFASGEARWLGVRVNGGEEQPRVMLLSVPYALKAGDAATIGGLPPSAFMLAVPPSRGAAGTSGDGASSDPAASAPPPASTVTTNGGTVNALPLWTTATNVQSSAITQTGSGATAKIGINTTAPTTALDVHGGSAIRGTLVLPATGVATASAGKVSQPENFVASSFSSATSTPVNQTFQWQAAPTNNNTSNPGATLNLLYGPGATTPAQTGLRIGPKGIIGFAPGQTFPGTGPGTVKSVGLTAPAGDFTVSGSPVSSTGTLNLAWTVTPTSADAANAIVKRDSGGGFTAGQIIGTSTGVAILGQSSGTGGGSDGVDGVTSSAGASGVAGINTSGGIGVYGTGGTGTFGTGVTAGVMGQSGPPSSIAADFSGGHVGVWGDGGTGTGTFPAGGVLGTSDDANAGRFYNNSPSGYYTLVAQSFNSGTDPFIAQGTGGGCIVDASGNLGCSGTKTAMVPVDGGKRSVAMSAIESPVNWFEDAGSGHLVNGVEVVELDPTFIQTVNTKLEYQVFLTPYGDCKGLYVTKRTANSFEVHELGGGAASLSFGYRIMAIRKNYENVRFDDRTRQMERMKQMRERMNRGKQQNPAAGEKTEERTTLAKP